MKTEIKNLRIQIDGLAQLTKELKPIKTFENTDEHFLDFVVFGKSIHKEIGFNSKEIEKVVDSLYLAKAWLGKILGELGETTPYANDGQRKTVKDIEPTADQQWNLEKNEVWNTAYEWSKKSHIEKVDWLREQIKDIIDNTEDFSETIDYIELEQGFVYKYLCEARFWLGFELERLKNEK